MSETLDLGDLERFTVGTVGEVGRRVFLIQCDNGVLTLTVKVEKQQVAVLAEYLVRLLGDLPPAEAVGIDMNLDDDAAEPRWVVGTLGVSYDEDTDRIILVAEELVSEDEDGDVARCAVTRAQATAFAEHASELVEAGRPPCPMCGLPLDPAGHECPRTNGHRPPIT
jgi:uncharacterized repeat protein (TIGR03847 family)